MALPVYDELLGIAEILIVLFVPITMFMSLILVISSEFEEGVALTPTALSILLNVSTLGS
jgi:hypothetical protein